MHINSAAKNKNKQGETNKKKIYTNYMSSRRGENQ